MTAPVNWIEEIKQRLANATLGKWRHQPISHSGDSDPSFAHPDDWHVVSDNNDPQSKPTVVVGLEWYDCAWLGLSVHNGALIANAPQDLRALISELESPVWIVDYHDTIYLARGEKLLGSYSSDEATFQSIDKTARALATNVRYADGWRLFGDRLGTDLEAEGDYLAEWLLSESTTLFEPYEITAEDEA